MKRQTGYALCRSSDGGATWSDPVPVNTAPMADSGTGPYVVDKYEFGKYITLKRDTNWWGRDLAIKVLLESHTDKPEVIQRFIEEAQIGGQL